MLRVIPLAALLLAACNDPLTPLTVAGEYYLVSFNGQELVFTRPAEGWDPERTYPCGKFRLTAIGAWDHQIQAMENRGTPRVSEVWSKTSGSFTVGAANTLALEWDEYTWHGTYYVGPIGELHDGNATVDGSRLTVRGPPPVNNVWVFEQGTVICAPLR